MLPPTWVDAASRHWHAPAGEAEAITMLLGSWDWQRQQEPLTLVDYRVQHGTQLQLSGLQQQRQQTLSPARSLGQPAWGGAAGKLRAGRPGHTHLDKARRVGTAVVPPFWRCT